MPDVVKRELYNQDYLVLLCALRSEEAARCESREHFVAHLFLLIVASASSVWDKGEADDKDGQKICLFKLLAMPSWAFNSTFDKHTVP